jgi:hypothetical protein
MAEQTTLPGDESQQREPAADDPPSGQPSQAQPASSPPVEYGPPDVAGPADLTGPPAHATLPGQLGELAPASDITAQETGPPSARSRDRKVIVGAISAVVLIAVGTVLGFVLSSNGGNGPSFPSTLLGLTRDTSPDAQQGVGQITSEMGGVFQGFVVNLGAAVYGNGPPSQGVAVLTGQWSDAAKADGGIPDTSSDAVGELQSDGATDVTVYPPGPKGGGLVCGDATIGGQSTVVCTWVDAKMFGYTFYFGVASSLSDAAAKTIQVRSAVEH